LIAPFRTLSFVVRDSDRIAVTVRVRLAHGSARLRYAANLTAPLGSGRATVLPLVSLPIEGSPYRLVNLDLANDVTRLVPRAALRSVLGVRLGGTFRVGDLRLREP